MLCQFSFKNYKCFKNEAFLDFFAEPIDKNDNKLIIDKYDKEKFLPVIAIYGPNGGGKSTVLEALSFLRIYILHKIAPSQGIGMDGKEDISKSMKIFSKIDITEKYHKFDPLCKGLPIVFDVLFRAEEKEYRYQLSLLNGIIVEENLYMQYIGEKDAQIIFERSDNDAYLGDSLKGISLDKVKNTMPFLSHISLNYDIDVIDSIINWFSNITILDYDNPIQEKQILFPKTKSQQQKLFEIFQEMDINISDFRVEEDLNGNISNIYTQHTLENGTAYKIPIEEESSGTRKLFSCLAIIMRSLQSGNLIIADELDAKLHPKLLRYIIELFTNTESNKNAAQLLLTSHDITTMIPEVFRRDEIWFCALNPDNASKLYSLISFRKENGKSPRNDEAYGKQYIEGKYGADPYIRQFSV